MNRIAYRTTGLAIKTFANLSKAQVVVHGSENIPQGSRIFVVNHFTRLETFLVPYYLNKLTKLPIWSLAAAELFVGAFGKFLDSVGAVSTSHPDRDKLIVKSLLINDAAWVIFPEGRMVKNKKIIEKGRYMVSYAGGKHPPHTGAAALALRTEFYRRRLLYLSEYAPEELQRLLSLFDLDSMSEVATQSTYIVPVNLTYYPLRARINILNKLARRLVEQVPERLTEELMTEGAMLISGVDIDIRIGPAIDVAPHLNKRLIQRDIQSRQSFNFDDPLPSLKIMRRGTLQITQRYMEAIYHLTTVNHDHIFASLIKHSPINRIRLSNLKMRAFLAISQQDGTQPVHLHNSLQTSQHHLLIDDRHSKLNDFLNVAQEKGVLEVHPSYLIRDRHKLGAILDFHRARVDNPVAVMANEIEPLIGLQKKIIQLCRRPGFWLRRAVARHLKQSAEKAFEADYHRFYVAGESKPKAIGKPVLIRGRSRRLGVVICHGYMAAPAEVKTLADHLGHRGYWVYTPRLKGHGTAPEDLARCSYQDWIHSMEQGYLLMRHQCRRVVVGGFSTGAALALELAQRIPDIAAVFAVSTPLRLKYMTASLAPVVDTWNRLMNRVHLDEAKMEFVENQPENPHINYLRNPISGVRELEKLMDYIEPKLPTIEVPVLVVQAQHDPVVNPKGSEQIFGQLGSVDKQYLEFNFNRHGILLGEGSRLVHAAIGRFVNQIAAGPAGIQPGVIKSVEDHRS